MISSRLAGEADIPKIRELFLSAYGELYPYKEVYDEQRLKRSIYSDGLLIFVAEDLPSRMILGTASVVFEAGSYSDLLGELGRLVVHPEARNRGIAALLMQARLEAIRDRLHVAVVEPRTAHAFSQKNAEAHGFVPVGYQPLKGRLHERESLTLHVHYFGEALRLRKNHPRVIPEVASLAHLALANVGLPPDCIVDDDAPAYPHGASPKISEIASEELVSLLRIERGRIRHREIFGNLRLHYGIFRILRAHSNYLVARERDQVFGALGFTFDEIGKNVRIFELIAREEPIIRSLLQEVERQCRSAWGIDYIEVDVSAHSPRMQRTLLEEGFVPVAFVPAMVFHDVERLDIIRMIRLLVPPPRQELGELTPRSRQIAELALGSFRHRAMTPRLREVMTEIPLFHGMTAEQLERVISVCGLAEFQPDAPLFQESDQANTLYLLLQGSARIERGAPPRTVGIVQRDEALGEAAFLSEADHSASAFAQERVEAATLTHEDFTALIRQRPGIGMILYRNLARGLGRKLQRLDGESRQEPEAGLVNSPS